MSIYAVVEESIRNHPDKTAAEIAALTGSERLVTDPQIRQLVSEGRVVQTGGDFETATFAPATPPHEY